MLIKDVLQTPAHGGYDMIWTIECCGVLKYQTNVGNEFIGTVIARSIFIEIRFDWVRRNKFAIDCGKIHGSLDNGWIMWDIESHNVDRS